MKIEDIKLWEAFVAVAEKGQFSSAAQHLRTPLPQVSKRISKLEEHLGMRLFQRTTRAVTLTDEGRVMLPKIESILADLAATENHYSEKQRLSGTIKITSVPFVAHRLLLPSLKKFMTQYPEIKLELDLSEKFVNLVESGFDVALRIDTPQDSEMVYRKLVSNDLIFCATPAYLKKSPKISREEDLKKHSLLMMSIHHRCRFVKSQEKLGAYASAKALLCENGAFLTDMALSDLGVVVRSVWDVREHLKKGRLQQVLKEAPLESFGHIYAVVPTRRFVAPRVRAFLDFIYEESKNW